MVEPALTEDFSTFNSLNFDLFLGFKNIYYSNMSTPASFRLLLFFLTQFHHIAIGAFC